jgi:ABC-type glycerol-3-phosphate transport system permease component
MRRPGQPWLHLLLALVALLFLAPLLWMLVTAFQVAGRHHRGVGRAPVAPPAGHAENFQGVLGKVEEFPIWRWTGNSVFISLARTASC